MPTTCTMPLLHVLCLLCYVSLYYAYSACYAYLWDMLFADDIVLSRQNHRELEDDLEIWRNALERRGLKGKLEQA